MDILYSAILSFNMCGMYLLLIVIATLGISGVSTKDGQSPNTTPTQTTLVGDNRTISSNLSQPPDASTPKNETVGHFLPVNSGVAMRTFYVVAFCMATVVIYFVVRAVRLRRRKSKSRKYGVITSTSALEMEPLEKGEEDDDEDTTLFEVHHHNKYGQK